jgi:ketosteroid isomerase-like protein
MKKLVITIPSLLIFFYGFSQNEKIEKEIRLLEEKRIAAFLKKDTATLLKIWSPDYVVNRPVGRVSTGADALELVLTDSLSFRSYKFDIEKITVKNNFVITMGNDTIEPSGKNRNAGKTLKRRFTHIWTKEDGNWRLLARHANILCQ